MGPLAEDVAEALSPRVHAVYGAWRADRGHACGLTITHLSLEHSARTYADALRVADAKGAKLCPECWGALFVPRATNPRRA